MNLIKINKNKKIKRKNKNKRKKIKKIKNKSLIFFKTFLKIFKPMPIRQIINLKYFLMKI